MHIQYYNQTELISLGFTKRKIDILFPTPDTTCPNPNNKKRPIKKYSKERVDPFLTDNFIKERAKYKNVRHERSMKSIATRTANVLKNANQYPIILYRRDDIDQLNQDALWSHYDYHEKKHKLKNQQLGKYDNPPVWFIEHCTLNYILYNESNFKGLLETLKGSPNQYKAKKLIERKFYLEIAKRYPFLEEKCKEKLFELDLDEQETSMEYLESDNKANFDSISSILSRLADLETLESTVKTKKRNEQRLLKEALNNGKSDYNCCFCNEVYPIKESVCSHIKKHSECTEKEKRDYKIVMLACPICDILFEKGYVGVQNGIITIPSTVNVPAPYLKNQINPMLGNKCQAFNHANKKYFDWHFEYHTNRNKEI